MTKGSIAAHGFANADAGSDCDTVSAPYCALPVTATAAPLEPTLTVTVPAADVLEGGAVTVHEVGAAPVNAVPFAGSFCAEACWSTPTLDTMSRTVS
jgi:hypothetical protein